MDGTATKALYPGRAVPLGESGITAHVYPVGVKHLRRFSAQLGAFASLASKIEAKVELKAGMTDEEVWNLRGQAVAKRLMADLVPLVIANALDLVAECVTFEPKDVTLQDLAHWELPPIIHAWFLESFGEEKKLRPWMEAAEGVLEKILNRRISISETFSRLWSRLDTALTTSSAALLESSPTKAGV